MNSKWSAQQNITGVLLLSYVISCTIYSQGCIADIHSETAAWQHWVGFNLSVIFDDTAVNVPSWYSLRKDSITVSKSRIRTRELSTDKYFYLIM